MPLKQIETFINNSVKKEEKIEISNYLGYLEKENLNIKKLIKQGTSNNILNENIIGLYNNGNNLDSEKGQIILAGHNNEYVFKNLYKIRIGETIKIVTKNKEYNYEVTTKKTINYKDATSFKLNINTKELIIITCITDETRLLVFAKPK